MAYSSTGPVENARGTCSKSEWIVPVLVPAREQDLPCSIRITRLEFGDIVSTTIGQIESAQFPAHSGIRFPQNGCMSCAHLGLCLHDKTLIGSNLTLALGASNLAWLDQLVD